MHEYMRRLILAKSLGTFPNEGVWDTQCAHDDWCPIYKGKECKCDPDITMREIGGKQRVIGIDKNGKAKVKH